ncbi:MAG TPA: recombinase, partial [Porphyromonadaceae bacterium]|nr:recombinase [Porphyromonadaceae bacterium]
MENEVSAFLNYLEFECEVSPCTLSSYGDDLKQFEGFLLDMNSKRGEDGRGIDYALVGEDDVREWVMHLFDQKMEASSVRRKLATLRTFFSFLKREGKVRRSIMLRVSIPKLKKRLPQFLEEGEMDTLLDFSYDKDSFEEVRDRAILQTFYQTGIRRAELLSLKMQDVDLSSKWIKVLGKGNKERTIPFGEELKSVLEEYLALRGKISFACDNFFVKEKGEEMSAMEVYWVVRNALTQVSTLQKRSPHVL